MTRQAVVVGEQAAQSMVFCRRLARRRRNSEPSGDQATAADVMADDMVVERLAVAHVDLRRLPAGDVVDEEVRDRLAVPGDG